MKRGTINELRKIGTVKKSDKGSSRMKDFGEMPINEKGWLNSDTLFKIEK